MTSNNGAGVTERQEDWTFESIFIDWTVQGKLSRRKTAFLEELYKKTIEELKLGLGGEPEAAPEFFKTELSCPHFSYKCQCLAEILDLQKPRGDSLLTRDQEIYQILKKFLEELEEDWTVDSIINDWIKDEKNISRKKLSYLENYLKVNIELMQDIPNPILERDYANVIEVADNVIFVIPNDSWKLAFGLSKKETIYRDQCIALLLDKLCPTFEESRHSQVTNVMDDISSAISHYQYAESQNCYPG